MSEYYRVCGLDDVPEGGMLASEVEDYEIVLIKADGKVYALEDRCSHEDFPLCLGNVEGKKITCAKHGAEFDIETGGVLKAPALVPVKTYPVKVEDGEVFVELD